MGTRRIRRNRNVGNKLNDIDSRIASVEKKTVQDSSIGSTQIATEGVSTDNVQNRAVTSDKIELGAVGSEHLGLVNELSSGGNLSLNIGGDGYVVVKGTKYESPYTLPASVAELLSVGFDPTSNAVVVVPSTAGSVGGAVNLSNGTKSFAANTNTKVAILNLVDGLYAVRIAFPGDGGNYWSTSLGGTVGITSASGQGYYNSSPSNQLVMNSTQHHRTVNLPNFYMYSDSSNGAYGYLSLYANFPVACSFSTFEVWFKRLF